MLVKRQDSWCHDVQVNLVVERRRTVKATLEAWSHLLGVVDRNDDSETVETACRPVDRCCGDHCGEGFLRPPVGTLDLEDVHKQPPTDVDSGDPGVLFLGELGVGVLDPLQDVIWTTAPES